MRKSPARQSLVLIISLSVVFNWAIALVPQDIAGGGFQGQDIMGGAAIIFKRPARLKDLVGGTAMLVVKRPPRSPRTTEIARNNPRRPPRPGETPATPGTSDADKAEAYKDQGNTYYDVGQFDKA